MKTVNNHFSLALFTYSRMITLAGGVLAISMLGACNMAGLAKAGDDQGSQIGSASGSKAGGKCPLHASSHMDPRLYEPASAQGVDPNVQNTHEQGVMIITSDMVDLVASIEADGFNVEDDTAIKVVDHIPQLPDVKYDLRAFRGTFSCYIDGAGPYYCGKPEGAYGVFLTFHTNEAAQLFISACK